MHVWTIIKSKNLIIIFYKINYVLFNIKFKVKLLSMFLRTELGTQYWEIYNQHSSAHIERVELSHNSEQFLTTIFTL